MLYPCNTYILHHWAFIGAQSGDTGLDWFAMGTQNEVRGVGGIGNKAYKRQQACAWSCEPEIPPSPQNSFGVQDSLFFCLWLLLCCSILCLWSWGGFLCLRNQQYLKYRGTLLY